MAKVKRKYPPAFKINGQLIRLADGETKEDTFMWLDYLERELEKPKYANDPDAKAHFIDGLCRSGRGQALHSAIKAKGFI